MSYIVKAKAWVKAPLARGSDRPEVQLFWHTAGLFSVFQGSLVGDSVEDVLIELELDAKPKIFEDLEQAGLKIGIGDDAEISLTIETISALGVTLAVNGEGVGEGFLSNLFIPMSRVISMNDNAVDVAALSRKRKAAQDSNSL